MVCIWSFNKGEEVSIMFLVVNASRISFVAVFSEGWGVFTVVLVVSLAVMPKAVPTGSAIKGTGNLVIPAVTL